MPVANNYKNELNRLKNSIENRKIKGFSSLCLFSTKDVATVEKFSEFTYQVFRCGGLYHIEKDIFAFFSDYNINEKEAEISKELNLSIAKLREKLHYDIRLVVNFTVNNSKEKSVYLRTLKGLAVLINQKEEDEKNKFISFVKSSVENENISIVYQPIVDNSDCVRFKSEALVRLVKDGELIAPYRFLDIVGDLNLNTALTRAVVGRVLEEYNYVKEPISINITYNDIEDKDTKNFILNALKEFSKPEEITLEIIESYEIKEFRLINEFIREVKRLGTKISLDDFGTKYSNFGQLVHMDIDYLKIDGKFVKNLYCKKCSAAIKSMISYCKSNNIKTIAEFVENKTIYERMKDYGITYSQGYYFGKPEILKGIN